MSRAAPITNDRPASTPVELLRQIDAWLSAICDGDADHPWRTAIAETLGAEAATTPEQATGPGELFNELATIADGLVELLQEVACKEASAFPALSVASHLGWMADAAAQAHGHESYRGGAEDWLLSPRGRSALNAAQRPAA